MGSDPSGGVNLSKITLTKESPTVSLTKAGISTGDLRINLNWTQESGGKRRLFGGGSSAVDLDLGCLYELTNGDKGCVQALGDAFGSLTSPPYIALDGDDRSGSSTLGENLRVNLAHVAEIKRVLVYTYIYEGAPSWDKAQAVVTLFPAKGPQVEIKVDENAGGSRMVALALFENQGGDLVMKREVKYIGGMHPELDQQYGWGMSWQSGRK